MANQADKLKLLEMTFNKVASDPAFLAWHLHRFSQLENRPFEQVQLYLHCAPENFYRLGLSKVPEMASANYASRMLKISDYSGVSIHKLNYVLFQVRQVESILNKVERKTLEASVFSNWLQSENKILKTGLNAYASFENSLRTVYNRIPVKVYRGGFALLAIVLAIFISTSKVDEKNFYASAQKNYKENNRYLALQDNTQVIKAGFKKV